MSWSKSNHLAPVYACGGSEGLVTIATGSVYGGGGGGGGGGEKSGVLFWYNNYYTGITGDNVTIAAMHMQSSTSCRKTCRKSEDLNPAFRL